MKKKRTAVIGMVVCFMMMAAGAAWSENRAAIPPNGTLTDTTTGLVWLQNASCFGAQNWQTATNSAAGLKSGSCGLTDGSSVGQWRLPTKDELANRRHNRSGFNNVQSYYWSSTTTSEISVSPHTNSDSILEYAYAVNMANGAHKKYKDSNLYVWPVRSGE